MRQYAYLALILLLWAQEVHHIKDPLHGYEVRLPQGWAPLISQNLISFYHRQEYFFVCIGALKAETSMEKATQRVLAQLRHVGGSQAAFYTRRTPKGIEIVGERLSFPYFLNPIFAVTPRAFPTSYRFLGEIFPGQSAAILTFFWIPVGSRSALMNEAREIVASVKFLPANQRTAYKEETLRDPYLQKVYGTLHVPIGSTVRGTPYRQGTKYFYRIELSYQQLRWSQHALDIQTNVAMGMSGVTQLTYDGQTMPSQSVITIQQPEELAQLLPYLWQGEGQMWTLTDHKYEISNWGMQPNQPFVQGQSQQWQGRLEYQAGQRLRYVDYLLNVYQGALDGMGSFFHQATVLMDYTDIPNDSKKDFYNGLKIGMLASLITNPEWSLAAYGEFMRTNQQINAQLAEYLRQRRMSSRSSSLGGGGVSSEEEPFHSEMARTWSNALSDQTYIKDPESGEVMRVYKKVWDEGRFWQDPTFKDIYGTVERGSGLERYLIEKGWTPVAESLSGFGN